MKSCALPTQKPFIWSSWNLQRPLFPAMEKGSFYACNCKYYAFLVVTVKIKKYFGGLDRMSPQCLPLYEICTCLRILLKKIVNACCTLIFVTHSVTCRGYENKKIMSTPKIFCRPSA